MRSEYNLTKGPILKQLIMVSLPVMGTSFVQMFYNMTDLFWLGQVNDNAISSAGFGGMFMWLGAAVFILVKIGTEVRVAQRYGKEMYDDAKVYARTGIQIEFIFALIYASILFFFADHLMGIFDIGNSKVHLDAVVYLQVISFGIIFYSLNPVFTAALNGTGNTVVPFLLSASGLVINMALDPLFILGFDMGVRGAAIATVIAQFSVAILFVIYFKMQDSILSKMRYFGAIDWTKAKDILRLGLPVAIQSALFTFIAMYITRLVEDVGSESAIAIQKVGQQIEALSWLVAGGISTALGAFVGQNFGAERYDRLKKGVKYALGFMSIYGIFVSLLLYLGSGVLMNVFVSGKEARILGVDYLQILAYSQLFMIIEGLMGGAFNGLGKTTPPSVVSIGFNFLRIPAAIWFSHLWGLNGIWIAITGSSILKGTVIYIWYTLYIHRTEVYQDNPLSNEINDDKMILS